MSRTKTDEYFQNRQEQNRIKTAVVEAIPTNVYYHNIILALTDLLQTFVHEAYQEEVYTKAVKGVNDGTLHQD